MKGFEFLFVCLFFVAIHFAFIESLPFLQEEHLNACQNQTCMPCSMGPGGSGPGTCCNKTFTCYDDPLFGPICLPPYHWICEGHHTAAVPSFENAYTADVVWAECGSGQGGTCSNATQTQSFDGELEKQGLFVGSSGFHDLKDGKSEVEYQWNGEEHDCTSQTIEYPIESDFAWLKLNTTKSGGLVKCPNKLNRMCNYYYGPWPTQVTSLAQLWVYQDTNAPFKLMMECSIFPFTIYKEYTSIKFGKPSKASITKDKSCNQRNRSNNSYVGNKRVAGPYGKTYKL